VQELCQEKGEGPQRPLVNQEKKEGNLYASRGHGNLTMIVNFHKEACAGKDFNGTSRGQKGIASP